MNKSYFLMILMCILALPGCLKYCPTVLRSRHASETKSVNGVRIGISQLDQKNTENLFCGRGKKLTKGKTTLIPVQIYVENTTNAPIIIKPAQNAVKNEKEIVRKVEKNVGGITTGSVIGGFLIAGPIGAAALGTGLGMRNAHINDEIRDDVRKTSFFQSEHVPAHETFNKIMYVRKSDYTDEISLVVNNTPVTVTVS